MPERELRPGDLIWVDRMAKNLPYNHCGIYEGDDSVIHFAAPEGSEICQENAVIHRASLEVFRDGCPLKIISFPCELSVEETLRRARSRIGEKGYSFTINNCDHFATWCKTGEHHSLQAEGTRKAVRAIGGEAGEIICTIHEIAERLAAPELNRRSPACAVNKDCKKEETMDKEETMQKEETMEEDKRTFEEKNAENVAEQVTHEVVDIVRPLADMVKGGIKGVGKALLDALNEILPARVLTYETAMKYFTEHKDDSPRIIKGALLREAAEDGFIIFQVFLDKDGKLIDGELGRPLGCKWKVDRLDEELQQVFKNYDLVIVE